MKFVRLGILGTFLLGTPMFVQAQTISGKGIDTSPAVGYGAQIQLKDIQTQLNSTVATVTSDGDRLDGLDQRLNELDQQLNNLSIQLSSLSQTLQTLQTSQSTVTADTTAQNETGNNSCPTQTFHISTLPNRDLTAFGASDGGLSTADVGNFTISGQLSANGLLLVTLRCHKGHFLLAGAQSSNYHNGTRSSGSGSPAQTCISNDGKNCIFHGQVAFSL